MSSTTAASPSTELTPDLQNGSDGEALGGKYLTFNLDHEEFGIEILSVREIIGLMPMTAVPGAPEHIRGVINLRGKIIPVMELRKRFELETVEDHDRNCIIVVELTHEESVHEMGLLVDTVSEVLNIDQADIEPTPEFGGHVDDSFIMGLAKSGSQVKILLNIGKIVRDSQETLDSVASA